MRHDIGIHYRSDGGGVDIFPHYMIKDALIDTALKEDLDVLAAFEDYEEDKNAQNSKKTDKARHKHTEASLTNKDLLD